MKKKEKITQRKGIKMELKMRKRTKEAKKKKEKRKRNGVDRKAVNASKQTGNKTHNKK